MNFLRNRSGQSAIVARDRHESSDNNEQVNKSSSSALEDHKLKDPFSECTVKMLNFVRELMIFCLILMAYSAITNDPPKLSKPPVAYPFFPKDSLVKDFYRGQIITAIDYARTTDLSFIMFYAPWDAASRNARKEFSAVASFMKDYFIFSAVNCWQPGSECRNQYNKVYRWPVLIVYPSFGTGIQYNGPVSAPHMISFLNKLMKPIKRINETHNFDFEEAFVVAELNTLPKSLEYSVYYTVALKYLEADYQGRITFYVKPVKVSQNKISLYLWNQVRVLDIENDDWKVESILQWIIKTSESPSSWVSPSGSKSLLLSDHLQPGPALILFTPANPLLASMDYYMMLQEIAQEYKNCDNWGLTFDMGSKRLNNLLVYNNLKRKCRTKTYLPKKITSVTTNVPFLNNTRQTKVQSNCDKFQLMCQNSEECYKVDSNVVFGPENKKVDQNTHTYDREQREDFYPTSMLLPDLDLKSMQNLKKQWKRETCRTFLLAEKLHSAAFVPKDDKKNEEEVSLTSVSCSNTNQSLTFIAIDSIRYYAFAERLGIDVLKKSDKTAVVIIDEKIETHYIMEELVTRKSLRNFIQRYNNGSLTRSSESVVSVLSLQHSPFYSLKAADLRGVLYVEELTSKNFLTNVMQPDKAVLVMYYSKQCSYCTGISYTFLTVARKLSFVNNIRFARIDGDLNILPWEYTMEEFPTILFFPASRKEESRVFPSAIPITVPNILGFILSNVDVSMKLHVMYSVCLHNPLTKDKNACLSRLRNETTSQIERSLRDWRKSGIRNRPLVMHNLKQLRQLQFLFTHSPQEFLVIEKFIKQLKVYHKHDYVVEQKKNESLIKDEL